MGGGKRTKIAHKIYLDVCGEHDVVEVRRLSTPVAGI